MATTIHDASIRQVLDNALLVLIGINYESIVTVLLHHNAIQWLSIRTGLHHVADAKSHSGGQFQ